MYKYEYYDVIVINMVVKRVNDEMMNIRDEDAGSLKILPVKLLKIRVLRICNRVSMIYIVSNLKSRYINS